MVFRAQMSRQTGLAPSFAFVQRISKVVTPFTPMWTISGPFTTLLPPSQTMPSDWIMSGWSWMNSIRWGEPISSSPSAMNLMLMGRRPRTFW